MTPRRRCLVGLGLGGWVTARARAVGAPPPGQRRLGVLSYDQEHGAGWPQLRQALAALGWGEGKNLRTEWHYANRDAVRLAVLAAALVRSGVDAVLTNGSTTTRALQRASQTLPIITGVGDPVGSGFAQTLARPGGNITGLSWGFVETTQKQLQFLREMVPQLAHLTIIQRANRQGDVAEGTRTVEAAAHALAFSTRRVQLADADDLSQALDHASSPGTRAAYVFDFAGFPDSKAVVAALMRAQLPSVCTNRAFVKAGGLMSYNLHWDDQFQRFAAQIDKVFRGEDPAQIPFEFPTLSDFFLNAKTAKALGLAILPSLRLRADEVIE